jgi:hypothetical protein
MMRGKKSGILIYSGRLPLPKPSMDGLVEESPDISVFSNYICFAIIRDASSACLAKVAQLTYNGSCAQHMYHPILNLKTLSQ